MKEFDLTLNVDIITPNNYDLDPGGGGGNGSGGGTGTPTCMVSCSVSCGCCVDIRPYGGSDESK
ncbi:hypothetical protein ACLM5H_19450 [Fredinandcohnia humi]